MAPQTRQYGTWESDITLDVLCSDFIALDSPRTFDGRIYIVEGRNDGKNTIVELDKGGNATEVLPECHSIGNSVHEYGGGPLSIHKQDGTVIFSDAKDKGVYKLDIKTGTAKCLVKQDGWRFADFDTHLDGCIAAVREIHRVENDTPDSVQNELVLLHPEDSKITVLASGSDFYSTPRFGPDGKQLCWLQWDHPQMPWTGSMLYCATFDPSTGSLSDKVLVAGSGHDQGISQPRWGVDGALFFADDKTGYWQLYKLEKSTTEPRHVKIEGLESTDHASAEFKFGSCTYLPMTDDKLVLVYLEHGQSHVVEVDLATKTFRDLGMPIVDAGYDAMCKISDSEFVILGSELTQALGLYHVSLLPSKVQVSQIKKSIDLDIAEDKLSIPRALACKRLHGAYREGQVHGFFMPPCNPSFVAPKDTLPPLLVIAHGGPTGCYKPSFNLESQYWTSRGYAVYMLNYAGSTGYGKEYRDLLNGTCGALDVADAASAASHLAAEGLVDGSRMGVQGRSAGGYIVLQTVCDQPSVWAAGVSLFGISEVKEFRQITHKFESRYFDGLLFGFSNNFSSEEVEAILIERSPVHQVARIKAPLSIQQGDQDKVVPPQQAEDMKLAMEKHNKTVELMILENEGHSMWRGDAQRRSMLAQEHWWRKYLLRTDDDQ